MLVSALHAWLSISVRADQIISGTIINILAFGLTGLSQPTLISPELAVWGRDLQPLVPPDMPRPTCRWSAGSFGAFSCMGPIAISVLFFVIVLQILLFRSRWGLRTRAVGEHPKAAETVGIDVIRLRYRNVILAGVFAGLAGAYLRSRQTTPSRMG